MTTANIGQFAGQIFSLIEAAGRQSFCMHGNRNNYTVSANQLVQTLILQTFLGQNFEQSIRRTVFDYSDNIGHEAVIPAESVYREGAAGIGNRLRAEDDAAQTFPAFSAQNDAKIGRITTDMASEWQKD